MMPATVSFIQFMLGSVSCAVDEVIVSWNRQGDKIKKGCRIGAGPFCQPFYGLAGAALPLDRAVTLLIVHAAAVISQLAPHALTLDLGNSGRTTSEKDCSKDHLDHFTYPFGVGSIQA